MNLSYPIPNFWEEVAPALFMGGFIIVGLFAFVILFTIIGNLYALRSDDMAEESKKLVDVAEKEKVAGNAHRLGVIHERYIFGAVGFLLSMVMVAILSVTFSFVDFFTARQEAATDAVQKEVAEVYDITLTDEQAYQLSRNRSGGITHQRDKKSTKKKPDYELYNIVNVTVPDEGKKQVAILEDRNVFKLVLFVPDTKLEDLKEVPKK